jgi:hypothetical protein
MYAPNDLFYENRIRFSEIILTYVLLLFKSLCLCTLGHACHIKYMCYLSLNLNLLTEWKVTLLKWWRCLIVLSIHVSLNCQFAKPLKQEVDMWFYSEASFWLPLSKSILLLLDAACLVEIDWLIDYYLTFSEQYFRVADMFSVLCCSFVCLYVLSSVLSYPLRFPHKHDVLFVFTSSCLQECFCLIYGITVCLRIVVSSTLCCCAFLFYSSCVTCPF